MTPAFDDPSFDLISALQSAKANAEDKARQDRAMAGLETGDGNAHEHKSHDRVASEKRRKSRSRDMTALDLALQNASYEALYADVGQFLRDSAVRIEAALDEAQRVLRIKAAELQDILGRATALPDGTKVFRTRDGRIMTEKGREIGGEEEESIVWKDDCPSYEDFRARREARDDAARRIDELTGLQNDIADAQEQMENPNAPLSEGELADLREGIDSRMSKSLTGSAQPESSVASQQVTADMQTPTLD